MSCCRAFEEDWLRLSRVVQDKVQLEARGLEVAQHHKQRLLRLQQSQEQSCLSKKEFPKVMAALWEMDAEDVENCIDFGVCLQAGILWVEQLKHELQEHSSGRFSSEVQVCSKEVKHFGLVGSIVRVSELPLC
jgi:hypothetical protein